MMSTTVAKKKPAAKRSKTIKPSKLTKAELKACSQIEKHFDFLKHEVGRKFTTWRKWNPTATLGDLLQFLERVQDELLDFNDDDILAEIEGDLTDAADWLATWGPIEEHVDGDDEPATVEYRLADVEEDIGQVEKLVEALGESFSVHRLPKRKPRTKPA